MVFRRVTLNHLQVDIRNECESKEKKMNTECFILTTVSVFRHYFSLSSCEI
jgi:hypothetical protein